MQFMSTGLIVLYPCLAQGLRESRESKRDFHKIAQGTSHSREDQGIANWRSWIKGFDPFLPESSKLEQIRKLDRGLSISGSWIKGFQFPEDGSRAFKVLV